MALTILSSMATGVASATPDGAKCALGFSTRTLAINFPVDATSFVDAGDFGSLLRRSDADTWPNVSKAAMCMRVVVGGHGLPARMPEGARLYMFEFDPSLTPPNATDQCSFLSGKATAADPGMSILPYAAVGGLAVDADVPFPDSAAATRYPESGENAVAIFSESQQANHSNSERASADMVESTTLISTLALAEEEEEDEEAEEKEGADANASVALSEANLSVAGADLLPPLASLTRSGAGLPVADASPAPSDANLTRSITIPLPADPKLVINDGNRTRGEAGITSEDLRLVADFQPGDVVPRVRTIPALLLVRPGQHLGFLACHLQGLDVELYLSPDASADAQSASNATVSATGTRAEARDDHGSSTLLGDTETTGPSHQGVAVLLGVAPLVVLTLAILFRSRLPWIRASARTPQQRDVPLTGAGRGDWQASDDEDIAVGGPLSGTRVASVPASTAYFSLATPRGGGL